MTTTTVVTMEKSGAVMHRIDSNPDFFFYLSKDGVLLGAGSPHSFCILGDAVPPKGNWHFVISEPWPILVHLLNSVTASPTPALEESGCSHLLFFRSESGNCPTCKKPVTDPRIPFSNLIEELALANEHLWADERGGKDDVV